MTTPDQPAAKTSGLYIRLADAIVAGGGLIMFLFSFAPFVSGGGVSQNAWSFLSPVVLFVVFAGVLLIGTALVDAFWHRDKQVVGVHRHQIQVGIALYALVTLLGFALVSDYGFGIGWGGFFMLIGAVAAAAGAVLNHFNMLQTPIGLPTVAVAVTPPSHAPEVPAPSEPPAGS
jgi:hypothetical protein